MIPANIITSNLLYFTLQRVKEGERIETNYSFVWMRLIWPKKQILWCMSCFGRRILINERIRVSQYSSIHYIGQATKGTCHVQQTIAKIWFIYDYSNPHNVGTQISIFDYKMMKHTCMNNTISLSEPGYRVIWQWADWQVWSPPVYYYYYYYYWHCYNKSLIMKSCH